MIPVWIFDIDGTLADIGHRLHYIQGEKKDWDAFFGAVLDDKPIAPVVEMLREISAHDDVVFFSGRRESCKEDTIEWLRNEIGVVVRNLYMRKNGDFRPDTIVKAEMLEQLAADGFEPFAIVEDRKCMVEMWRSKGFFVFDVNQTGKDY